MKKFFIVLFLNNFSNTDFTDQCLACLREGLNSLPVLTRGLSNLLERKEFMGLCFVASIFLQIKKKKSIPMVRTFENIREHNEKFEAIRFMNLTKMLRNECLRNKFTKDLDYQRFRGKMSRINSIEEMRQILFPRINREIDYKLDFDDRLEGASSFEDAQLDEDICIILNLQEQLAEKRLPFNSSMIKLYFRDFCWLIPNIFELMWLLIFGNKILLNLIK